MMPFGTGPSPEFLQRLLQMLSQGGMGMMPSSSMNPPPMMSGIIPRSPMPNPSPFAPPPGNFQDELKKRMGGNTGIFGTMFGNNPHPGRPLPQLEGPGFGKPSGVGMNQSPGFFNQERKQRLF